MITSSRPSDFSSALSDSGDDYVKAGFTAENICGEGATCVVYRMRLNGLLVAVKRLRPEYLTAPTYIAAYRKEFQIGQRLKHDALPVYRELKADIDEVYMVMDFIDGVTLSEFLQTEEGKGYFRSSENVRRFLTELLDAVGYLHRSGVIHCDLKGSNIMLRHSDRGVTLLDLDKSYCDILDRTHGGTPDSSDPLQAGDKPTASKDFRAIATLMDEIGHNVSGFPLRKFEKFRKECLDSAPTRERIGMALERESHGRVWITGIIAICVLLGLLYYIMGSGSTQEYDRKNEPVILNEAEDSIKHTVTPSEITTGRTENQSEIKGDKRTIIYDFDSEMSRFINEAEEARAVLVSGQATDAELHDLMGAIIESYTSGYRRVVDSAKERHTGIAGIDVEMGVARASEKSKAGCLYQEFIRAVADTLNSRHP